MMRMSNGSIYCPFRHEVEDDLVVACARLACRSSVDGADPAEPDGDSAAANSAAESDAARPPRGRTPAVGDAVTRDKCNETSPAHMMMTPPTRAGKSGTSPSAARPVSDAQSSSE
jgi:hypothetical protein